MRSSRCRSINWRNRLSANRLRKLPGESHKNPAAYAAGSPKEQWQNLLTRKGPDMLSRRDLLKSALASSSLLALGKVVPGFVYNTALAAEQGKDNILVVIEMNGGNDGLNMVI